MYAQNYRMSRALGALVAIIGAVGMYWLLTSTSVLSTSYVYPQHQQTPYGIILEVLMALEQDDAQLATRGDEACENDGCAALLTTLKTHPQHAELEQCLYDSKRIKIKQEYNPKSHHHMVHLFCAGPTHWAFMMTDSPDPRTQRKDAPWRLKSVKPIPQK